MSFDYDKLKNKEENNSYWASYSDLFMVLSLVFLLLYVFSSLRTSSFSIQQQMEHKLLTERNQDLEQQIKVYNTIKEEYLEKEAKEEDQKVYNELISRLDLLKDETNKEQEELLEKLNDSKQRKLALNKYQQLVRNMINSNLIAKNKIDRKTQEIKSKEKTIQEKENQVQALAKVQKEIQEKLRKVKTDLSKTEKLASEEKWKKEKLVNQLQKQRKANRQKIAKLNRSFKNQQKKKEQQFLEKLKKQKVSAKQREKRLKAFRAQSAKEKRNLRQKISQLDKNIKTSEQELKKAKARLNARKKLAGEISKNFKKQGIHAQVDPKTGDVVLSFGKEYFDTGRHSLKHGMKKILKKSMPVYANSLFKNKKIAKKISHVEIIGFASPTYKGKYIDPANLNEETRKAVNYNLDLSYYRARNIFNYIFDTKKIKFNEQKRLRKLVKVTGRSFLASEGERNIAGEMSQKEFCKRYDCKKAQRVIIKFDVKD